MVPVPPKALDLLTSLIEQRGDVVEKTELLRRVWPDTFVEEANLSVNVSILRKALGTQPGGRPWIQTVARKGYRFLGPASVSAAAPRTLAVLPFRPMAPSEADEHLGLGMADALITRLSGAGRVLVRPTSAIQKYAGREIDPREVGRELRVDAVLEGRLQREGARLRLTVQLVPVDGSVPLWADRFEEELTQLFTVQDAVAERLAAALALELSADARRRLSRHHTESLEAYQAYCRGRYFWGRFSPLWMWKAVMCFQEALALDPRYALPQAGLADAYLLAGFTGLLPPREAWELAAAAANHARELDDLLAEAHVSSAYVRLAQAWDWDAAEKGLLRAVELDPGSAAVHEWHGLYLQLRGRFAEASRAIARAEELDPLSPMASGLRALQLFLEGDYRGELTQARRSVELDPHRFVGHWTVGIAWQNVGDFDAAVAAHRRALELAEGAAVMKPVLARSLALAGRAAEARGLLSELDAPEAGFVSPYQKATVHLALGERERALELLRSACEHRDPWVLLLGVDPMLAPLRSDARLGELVARVLGPAAKTP